jgi:hypothetical protein
MNQTSSPYSIRDVDPARAEEPESMGSKDKFWFREGKVRWLFKYSRRLIVPSADTLSTEANEVAYTGEHWAEKLAAEIADALGIPHAVVELAQDQERRIPGAMVRDLKVTSPGALVHGNELLFELNPSYPKALQYHTREHTLDNIFAVLSRPVIGLPPGFDVPAAIRTAEDLFVGYLLLDALIGNTDRHHENWALIRSLDGGLVLAPSYDHASSLGRDLSGSQQQTRLTTRDAQATVEAYAQKARSAIYRNSQDRRPMGTLAAFAEAAARRPEAAHAWRLRLQDVPDAVLEPIVTRVPDQFMSASARQFVVRFLEYTRRQILDLDAG